MIDTSQTAIYVLSPMRSIMVGLTALLLVCVCVGVATGAFPDVRPRQQLYGWFGAVFFLVGAYAVFSRGLGKDRPTLTLSPHGFHFTAVSSETIPWTAVESIYKRAHGKTPLIIVKVPEEIWQTAGMTEQAVAARMTNKLRGIDGVAIASTGLPIKFGDLLAQFQAYAKAHGTTG